MICVLPCDCTSSRCCPAGNVKPAGAVGVPLTTSSPVHGLAASLVFPARSKCPNPAQPPTPIPTMTTSATSTITIRFPMSDDHAVGHSGRLRRLRQQCADLSARLVDRDDTGVDDEVGVGGVFIRIVDAGEAGDLAAACLRV